MHRGNEILRELALNIRWSWSHRADVIWQELEPELWELTQNPWLVMQTVSPDKVDRVLSDPFFYKIASDLVELNRKEKKSVAWFQGKHSGTPLKTVAYFSMEYMLTEALPIYSGGLGNVAGDQLKAASDLGVPVIGIGLLYQQGYFRQIIDKEGAQQPLYPFNDPGLLPITPLRKDNGEWLRLEVSLPGWPLWLRAWQVEVGRTKLYLLDSNDPANYPAYRGITSELYGGDNDLRFKQELILGIGGWRLLEALGIQPDVCHLNEGHAAFAVLERASSFMKLTGKPFDVALEATRPGNLFTTHTAVPAGFDLFPSDLIKQYLSDYAMKALGISIDQLLALGKLNPGDHAEKFNMAYLAIRGSGAINGVSELHGKVSRKIFAPLFPRWPEEEIPVGYVTNGVHVPTWDSAEADELWTGACGERRWFGEVKGLEKEINEITDEKIWNMRQGARAKLVEFTRKRLTRIFAARGMSAEEVKKVENIFDPNTLTLGFARRFATYKRPNLLLQNPERLLKIFSNSERPVQLVIAGKAHPADLPGQALIKEWINFIRKPEARPSIVFLSDYDMSLTSELVQGVDVWLNTPLRPWEACGTSGMKVLANGGLNVSELDGWWAEAYSPEVGWAIGDGQEHGNDPQWNAHEANALYDLLEFEIAPMFYRRDSNAIPAEWVAKIRASMSKLTPHFSANRAVIEYTEKYYIPAAQAYHQRAANAGVKSAQVLSWHQTIEKNWTRLHFGEIKVETIDSQYHFTVSVYLNDLSPKDLKIEMYANSIDEGKQPEHHEMNLVAKNGEVSLYEVRIARTRPASDYTARALPCFPGVSVPLEADEIAWQK